MRPAVMRKSKSQDTHDRRPVESVLTAEGVHHEIQIDDKNRKIPHNLNDMTYAKPGFRAEGFGSRPSPKGTATSSPDIKSSGSNEGGRVVHDNMSHRPLPTHPVPVPNVRPTSVPTTPIGKGHAHNPLEDLLYLSIGTGEDCPVAPEEAYIISESPSNADMNVYETAYEEEVQRIIAQRKDQYNNNRRPTLYLTRRVENVKSIRDNDCIFDEGQDFRRDVKASFKSFVTKTKEDIEARGELQKLQEGKEGKLSRTMRNVREAKRLVEEARERVKVEERERERERSRSATPIRKDSSGSGLSRSGTPVAG